MKFLEVYDNGRTLTFYRNPAILFSQVRHLLSVRVANSSVHLDTLQNSINFIIIIIIIIIIIYSSFAPHGA